MAIIRLHPVYCYFSLSFINYKICDSVLRVKGSAGCRWPMSSFVEWDTKCSQTRLINLDYLTFGDIKTKGDLWNLRYTEKSGHNDRFENWWRILYRWDSLNHSGSDLRPQRACEYSSQLILNMNNTSYNDSKWYMINLLIIVRIVLSKVVACAYCYTWQRLGRLKVNVNVHISQWIHRHRNKTNIADISMTKFGSISCRYSI